MQLQLLQHGEGGSGTGGAAHGSRSQLAAMWSCAEGRRAVR